MTIRVFSIASAVGLLLAGCTVGPDYQRPPLDVPAAYRGAPAAVPAQTATELGNVEWATIFTDPELQQLIRAALVANYDVQVAATRILQAQAQLTSTASFQWPTINGQADAGYTGYVGNNRPPSVNAQTFVPEGGVNVAWEIDFWGKFRRATQGAQAQLLASQDARDGVIISLIAQVAQSYFDLRTLDLDLEIARRTLASRQESLDLVKARFEGGVAGILDVQQAENLYYTAAKAIPDTERQIAQTENLINYLLGRPPASVPRGRPLTQQLALTPVPVGIPSELLARRPDVRQAEQQLVAANAQIGVAKAFLFPAVTLTGFAGAGGIMLNGQMFGPLGIFSVLPTITLPIFNAGRLDANVDFAQAQTEEAVVRYRQTIQQALREVADGIVEVQKRREFRVQQELLTKVLTESSETARLRYEGGVSSYLEVLDTDRQLFQAELDLSLAQRDELAGFVNLYKALGGGWQAAGSPPQG
ncbi:MAG TPA: efflux transporter outer membrane subunit [Candidatus Baltobacteraceae bacterium]|nr:efflux transporter outer membrane subunit [Candidatus Baltobacteraceae bacterium]